MKVLHCPYNIAGNPSHLSNAEKEQGLESHTLSFENKYGFKSDFTIESQNIFLFEIQRWFWLFRALLQYDIINFNFGSTLMPDWRSTQKWNSNHYVQLLRKVYIKLFTLKDLFLLKLFNKKIIVTFQGDDIRQADYCKKNYKITFANDVSKNYYLKGSDDYKRWIVAQFEKHADILYSLNPDLLNLLPARAKFLPYTNINPDSWKSLDTNRNKKNNETTIVHAPTDRSVKRTKYIVDAIDKLKREGLKFNFILVENMTREKAKKIYMKSDILVDQLLAGWYGGLAVELMALGKPVIAYIRNEDLKFVPEQMRKELPVINATPQTIYLVLKEYITTKKNKLESIRRRGRRYVKRWHNSYRIANQLIKEYNKTYIT